MTTLDQRTDWQKKYDAAIKNRVLVGIELLKEKYGEDWVEHVNPEELDLADSAHCVLGQLGKLHNYNHYYEEAEGFLGVKSGPTHSGATVVKCGFYAPPNLDEEDEFLYYSRLTNMWKCAIRKLRAGKSPNNCTPEGE